MLYLCLAILAFFAGVVVHPMLHGKTRLLATVDIIIVAGVLVLVALFMLPHTLEESGAAGALGVAAGLVLTAGLSRISTASTRRGRPWTIALLFGALLAHTAFDGAALAVPMHHEGDAALSVVAGVVVHRFPLGMALHHLLGPSLRVPLIAAFLLSLSTGFGYVFADGSFTEANEAAVHLLECFIVGMLIQVVFSHLNSLKALFRPKD